MRQEGNVRIFQLDDGGDVSLTARLFDMDSGLDSAAYLSLFGGPVDWWGNIGAVPELQYRGEFAKLLEEVPATTGNLRRLEDAALRDLKWFKDTGLATEVAVAATMPALNRVTLTVQIDQWGTQFAATWGSLRDEATRLVFPASVLQDEVLYTSTLVACDREFACDQVFICA